MITSYTSIIPTASLHLQIFLTCSFYISHRLWQIPHLPIASSYMYLTRQGLWRAVCSNQCLFGLQFACFAPLTPVFFHLAIDWDLTEPARLACKRGAHLAKILYGPDSQVQCFLSVRPSDMAVRSLSRSSEHFFSYYW